MERLFPKVSDTAKVSGTTGSRRLVEHDILHLPLAFSRFGAMLSPMTLQQTVTIPADQRLHINGPRLLTQAEFEAGLPCPMDHTPNAVTIAAMEEGDAILRGEIPAALTIDLSGCKTLEDIEAALHAAFEAADED
jgi:hypothetical protein